MATDEYFTWLEIFTVGVDLFFVADTSRMVRCDHFTVTFTDP